MTHRDVKAVPDHLNAQNAYDKRNGRKLLFKWADFFSSQECRFLMVLIHSTGNMLRCCVQPPESDPLVLQFVEQDYQ